MPDEVVPGVTHPLTWEQKANPGFYGFEVVYKPCACCTAYPCLLPYYVPVQQKRSE